MSMCEQWKAKAQLGALQSLLKIIASNHYYKYNSKAVPQHETKVGGYTPAR
jgi:hypothetical protein